MTAEQLNELEKKFEGLYWRNLAYPPLNDCDCPEYQDEKGRWKQDCVRSCRNWCNPEQKKADAFDAAVTDLHIQEGLSDEETASFVNVQGNAFLHDRNILPEHRITYRVHGSSGWICSWSWSHEPSAVLTPASQATSIFEAQSSTSESDTAPAGVAYALWKLLPSCAQGDLEEEYAQKQETLGAVEARRWLQKSVAASVWALAKDVTWKVLIAAAVRWVVGQGDR